jgi:predicted phage terminase large subunit-like protein
MNDVSNVNLNAKTAVAAPRSHAKSSFLSKAFPAHEIAFRKRKYIVIISETPAVATANLDWLALQLKSNAKLRADFGPILHPKTQMNPKDNTSEFIAWELKDDGSQRMLTKVEAASTGQALRGRNWNGVRPDLIICDDLEGKKNTNTEQLRSEMKDWFSQVVIPLGDPEGKKTALILMGTTVHVSALLVDVMKNRSDFATKIYRAIITQPTREDLWDECRTLYVDRENENRAADAAAFYHANKTDMDEGVAVLWPDVQPVYKLMTWKWDNGSKAFNTEYMNNPIDEESAVFVPDRFMYWTDYDPERSFSHAEYTITFGIDFALGKQRGDYSAICVTARRKTDGTIYVIDSYGERVHPDKFIDVIVARTLKWQPDAIAAEAVAAQEFFVDKLADALRSNGYPSDIRVHKIYQRARKELRIEAMLPDIESGKIRFSRRHALLLEQFELYGTNSHDDLPDSLEMAVSIANKRPKRKATSTGAGR